MHAPVFDMVPPGWSIKKQVIGAATVTSPSGKTFQGKIQAIKHMVLNNYPENEIEEMKKSLSHDGWKYDENLPTGWRYKCRFKKGGGYDYYFLTENLSVLDSTKQAQDRVVQLCNNIEIHKMQSFLKNLFFKANQNYANETLPKGWISKKGNFGKILFYSPDGKGFLNRVYSLKHMIMNNYPLQDILIMRSSLVFEGWKKDHRLPTDWRMKETAKKKKSYNPYQSDKTEKLFLTHRGDVVGTSKALDIITDFGTKSDIDIFMKLAGLGDHDTSLISDKPKFKQAPDNVLIEHEVINIDDDIEIVIENEVESGSQRKNNNTKDAEENILERRAGSDVNEDALTFSIFDSIDDLGMYDNLLSKYLDKFQ